MQIGTLCDVCFSLYDRNNEQNVAINNECTIETKTTELTYT